MKTKYPSIFGLLAAVLLVLSFVLPASIATPAAADAGVCKWDTVLGPGGLPLKNDVGSYEPHDMVVGGDSSTILVTSRYAIPSGLGLCVPNGPAQFGFIASLLFWSNNNGISFSTTKYSSFSAAFFQKYGLTCSTATQAQFPNVYDVAIAPDNPNFWAITTDAWDPLLAVAIRKPQEVWVTSNAGGKWDCANFSAYLQSIEGVAVPTAVVQTARCIDISVDYGGKRDIAVGTANGLGTGDVFVAPSSGFGGWKAQQFSNSFLFPLAANQPTGDFYAVKFSPTYPSDASLAVVFADSTVIGAIAGDTGNTWYNISQRDVDSNNHIAWAFIGSTFASRAVEIRDTSWGIGASPSVASLNRVSLQLPSDFSGTAASLRRAYISLDSYGSLVKGSAERDGIFRIDDTTIYTLMDTSNVAQKSIYSIAYFGTYASGKLLAGERRGSPCTATVPTWFTDSPTTCPVPCWYPALKPTTGSAAATGCGANGNGSAIVGWKADGNLAFVVTGSFPIQVYAGSTYTPATWYMDWNTGPISLGVGLSSNDESAFAISRNNGETWNQLDFINTTLVKLTDVAPTPDCKTVYLASVNTGAACAGFDSVWRSSSNTDVVSPYPPLPIGIMWERVLTRLTADNCTAPQTDISLLRIVPYCADPSGQIVAWGVYDHNHSFKHGIAAWSPDFGDYWANITVRDPIQDFTFESQTVMYFLSPLGAVQKMPYTGTAWSTTLSSVDSVLYSAHSIAAFPEGKVLVGADHSYHSSLYATSYSLNFNTDSPSFTVQSTAGRTPYYGDVHVAFDPNFSDTNIYFANDESYVAFGGSDQGSVYRNNPQAQVRWSDADMLDTANGAVGCFVAPEPQTGLVLGFTGGALYSSYWHPAVIGANASDNWSGVLRTIPADAKGNYGPLSGMPKPGIAWDDLTVGLDRAPETVEFTLQPTALKACGCCTLDTDTTLYAIDDALYVAWTHGELRVSQIAKIVPPAVQQGMLWAFTDCLAKRGPALITEDKTLIGCDPVSGRAQEVNLCWEQLCVANAYDIEIGKDADFTIKVIDWVGESDCAFFLEPADVTQPCVYFPAGGLTGFYSGSSIGIFGNLECGHTYYWRVKARECATTQVIRSPWSEVRSFTVKAGLPVVSTYLGLTLLAPNNGCLGCPVQPVSFSWSPFKETTKYKFVLASDAAMTQIVQEAETATTAFEYSGALDYSTNYFWRVMSEEPAPSDWSATFSFQTEAKPAAAAEKAPVAPTPIWVWVVIAIGAILVIVTLVLIFKTRRV